MNLTIDPRVVPVLCNVLRSTIRRHRAALAGSVGNSSPTLQAARRNVMLLEDTLEALEAAQQALPDGSQPSGGYPVRPYRAQ